MSDRTKRTVQKLSDLQKNARQFKDFRFEVDPEDGVLVVVDDLNAAAYLKILGYELYEARTAEGSRMFQFVFKALDQSHPQEAAQHILDFYNNRGVAGKYLDYTNAWKDLKCIMPRPRV